MSADIPPTQSPAPPPPGDSTTGPEARRIRCPSCHNPIQLGDNHPDEVLCPACGSSFRVRDSRLTSTTAPMRRLGKFQLLERVGTGAFGAVWKARDTELDRIVALKVPHAALLSSEEGKERFYREARAAAQLRHPGIVTVHEVADLDEFPAIVADFVEGVTLRELVQVRPLTFRESAELVAQVAEAVDYAHGMGLVHRDLKPGNIMMEFGGGVNGPGPCLPRVMDFGLALREEVEITLTLDGQLVGTPAYMSPEQAAGRGHHVDRRCDVYSLGVILYELLTGELPFRGTKQLILHQVLHEEPRPLRKLNDKVPRDLETICLKCLEKDPERRYTGAAELAGDLRRFLQGEPIIARPAGRVERLLKWTKRRPAVAALYGVSLLAVASFLVAGLWFTYHLDQARRNAETEKEKAEETAGKLETALKKVQKAEGDARQEAEAAVKAREKVEELLSVHKLNRAQALFREGNVRQAKELLDDIPPNQRWWEWKYLKRHFEGSSLTLYGHFSTVMAVVFSPDGRRLASASEDGTVKVWDADTAQVRFTLRGFKGPVTSVAFSPDGRHLAWGSEDRTVQVWDADAGRQHFTFQGHTDGVLSVAFSPDGRRLASASGDGTVKVWDMGTGRERFSLRGHTATVWSVAFSPNGRLLASGSGDATVKVWDAETGNERLNLQGDQGPVWSITFSPDGRRLASGSYSGKVMVWDPETGRERITYQGHAAGRVRGIAFSPDGRRLASVGDDGTVKVWDAVTGQERRTLRGHAGGVKSVGFSPDGRRLVSASEDRTVKIWDAERGQERLRLTFAGRWRGLPNVAVSPDGRQLGLAGNGVPAGWVIRMDFRSERERSRITSVDLSADGRRQASGSKDGTLKVWDAETKQECLTLQGAASEVTSVAFSRDGRCLASTDRGGTVQFWAVDTGRDLNPPDLMEMAYRRWLARVDPFWHQEQADQSVEAANWFAGAIHYAWLEKARPDDVDVCYRHGLTLIAKGDLVGFRRVCQQLHKRFGDKRQAFWLPLLVRDGQADAESIFDRLEMVKTLWAGDPVLRGGWLVRARRLAEAIPLLERAQQDRPIEDPPLADLLLILALCQQGKPAEAREALARVRLETGGWSEPLRDALLFVGGAKQPWTLLRPIAWKPEPPSWDWVQKLMVSLLQQEAEEALRNKKDQR